MKHSKWVNNNNNNNNRTTKSRKKYNPRRRNVQIHGIIGNWHNTSGDEEKIFKSISGECGSYSRQNYIAGTLWKG